MRTGERQDSAQSARCGPLVSGPSADRNVGLLRRRELAALRRLGTVRLVEAGTVVAASGSRVTSVPGVADGELELRARPDQGRATMAVERTGGVIADIPLLLGAPMPFDAVASRDAELIALSRQRWTQLLTGSPDLALRWMQHEQRRRSGALQRDAISKRVSRPWTRRRCCLHCP